MGSLNKNKAEKGKKSQADLAKEAADIMYAAGTVKPLSKAAPAVQSSQTTVKPLSKKASAMQSSQTTVKPVSASASASATRKPKKLSAARKCGLVGGLLYLLAFIGVTAFAIVFSIFIAVIMNSLETSVDILPFFALFTLVLFVFNMAIALFVGNRIYTAASIFALVVITVLTFLAFASAATSMEDLTAEFYVLAGGIFFGLISLVLAGVMAFIKKEKASRVLFYLVTAFAVAGALFLFVGFLSMLNTGQVEQGEFWAFGVLAALLLCAAHIFTGLSLKTQETENITR